MQTINERIQYIINKLYSGNVSEFERASEIKPYTVKNIIGGRQTKPSFDILESIVRNNVQISARWLLLGKGEMERQLLPGETLMLDEDESSIVYHYTNMNNFISILSSFHLKCSVIEKSNDYKEKRSIKEMSFHNRSYNDNLKYLSFCCGPFSYKNPTLWHHYADAHRGVCIGIDISDLDKSVQGGMVVYERNINDDKYTQEEYMARKTPEWMGELEYRLLFLDGRKCFDISDRLFSVCFGREVSDDIIKNILSKVLPESVNIFKIDVSSNGYLGRHNLFNANGSALIGGRKNIEQLDSATINYIRGEMEKQSSEAVSEDNLNTNDMDMKTLFDVIRRQNARLDELEKENADLRRKYEHSEERPAV